MKSVLVLSLLAFASIANAANFEIVNLGVAVLGEMCTGAGENVTCKTAPSSMQGAVIPVQLNQCSGTVCQGQWVKAIKVENQEFTAVVLVSHDTSTNPSHYKYTAAIGNRAHLNTILIDTQSGTLNDTTAVFGDTVNSTQVQGETIIPALVLGKVFTSGPLLQNFRPPAI